MQIMAAMCKRKIIFLLFLMQSYLLSKVSATGLLQGTFLKNLPIRFYVYDFYSIIDHSTSVYMTLHIVWLLRIICEINTLIVEI